jgi:predicted DNA-binding transcriptional regulator AlpA
VAEYSTAQVAKKLDIGRDTLHRWMNERLKAPKLRRVGNVRVRIWTEEDLKRAKAYSEARYRKKKPKL